MSGSDSQQDNQHQTYDLPHQIISNVPIDRFQSWASKTTPLGFQSAGELPHVGLLEYAEKERILVEFSSNIPINTSTSFSQTYEINSSKLMTNNIPARSTHTLFRFGATLKLQLNANDSYQGLLMLVYESWPYPDYYSEFINYGTPIRAYNWQIPYIPILLNQKQPIETQIPLHLYPFNYFWSPVVNQGEAIFNYMRQYPLGRITINQVTNCSTKSDVLQIPFIATTRLTNVQAFANRVRTGQL